MSRRRDGQRRPRRDLRVGFPVACVILAVHMALLIAAGLMVLADQPVDLNPSREKPTSPDGCRLLPVDDDLVHMALRPVLEAQRQAERWKDCHPSTIESARTAVGWDWWLIGVIAAGLVLASVLLFFRVRWRRSACFAFGFLLVYVAADAAENLLLNDYLDDPASWTGGLRWAAALKFGGLIAAAPIFLVSFVIAFGDVFGRRAADAANTAEALAARPPDPIAPPPESTVPAEQPRGRLGRFVADRGSRIARFAKGTTEATTPPTVISSAIPASVENASTPAARRPTAAGAASRFGGCADWRRLWRGPKPTATSARLGVASSGGGIRSAAFNLGAFQALDNAQARPDEPSELARASCITAVSGGSYLAAAWVSAREDEKREPSADEDPNHRAWQRGSDEEDHLRRHSSYIAPGFTGKLWAALRFLIGLLMNLLLVGLAIAAVALPYGWFVASLQESVPSSGGGQIVIATETARIRLPNGRCLIPVVGERVRLANGAIATLKAGVEPVSEPTTTPAPIVDAAHHGRILEPGSRVVLANRAPVEITGRVLGTRCHPEEASTATTTPPVAEVPKGSRYVVLSDGAELRRAARAVLTVTGKAIVQESKVGDEVEGRLFEACGAHACERVDDPWLDRIVWTVLGIALLLGMAGIVARPRERTAATANRLLQIAAAAGIAVLLLVLALPALVSWAEGQRWAIEDRGRIAGVGVLTVVLALVAQIVPVLGSGTAPSAAGKIVTKVKSFGTWLRPWLVRLAAYIALPLLLLGAALFVASYAAQRGFGPVQVAALVAVVGPLCIIGSGADLNQWSLHPYYRERLASAFGVRPKTLEPRPTAWLDQLPGNQELVVCAAANVSDTRITAPGRPVVSWVFSRSEVGAASLARIVEPGEPGSTGTVPAAALTGKLGHLRSLWTSVAVSGAAFSPSMGKMTRPERGLMALGNVRLGVWYPNPTRLAKNPTWYQEHHPTPFCLVKEAFGLHKADARWIYVTDGGHYENLGLVELLRRGVRNIYCFDASGDTVDTFGTIAEAMRLAREEMGFEIDFTPGGMKPDKQDEGLSELGVRAATISQRATDGSFAPCGWIVFAKLQVPENAPFDIVDLARTLPKFPNHPTTDQLYTDQKFEAYRALGHHLGEKAAQQGIAIRRRIEAGFSIPAAVAASNLELAPPRAVASAGGAVEPGT